MTTKRLPVAAAALLLLGASPAFAHLDPAAHGSMAAGLSHPLFGFDHVLAMVAVGLWAAQSGGRAVYAVPLAFVGTMIVGFLLGSAGAVPPFVEPMIVASVVALGLLVAAATKLPAALGMGIVGGFALFHGIAHASELGGASALSFGAGFVLSTALLHAAGIGLGLAFGRGGRVGRTLGRLAGAGTAAAGFALMLG